jgi:hypothetical protein
MTANIQQMKAELGAYALREKLLEAALANAAKQFDSIVSAMAQGHTVSISSVQNCAAKARATHTP